MYVCVYIYIYIYIYRERYIYIDMCTYIASSGWQQKQQHVHSNHRVFLDPFSLLLSPPGSFCSLFCHSIICFLSILLFSQSSGCELIIYIYTHINGIMNINILMFLLSLERGRGRMMTQPGGVSRKR